MTLKHLKIFQQVCMEGSITRAAEKLYMSQPAVSLAIKQLEEYYDIKLFDRIAHKLHLTSTGRTMQTYAEQILHKFGEMVSAISEGSLQEYLNVGCSAGTLRFALLMKGFEDAHPNVLCPVQVTDTKTVVKKVRQNEFDIGVIEDAVSSRELCNIIFGGDEMVVICAPTHPLAQRGRVPLADLLNERFLLREPQSGPRIVIDSVFSARGYKLMPFWESGATQLIIDAVMVDLGISILPKELVENAVRDGRLCIVEVSDASFMRNFSIIYRKDKYLSQALKLFIEYFTKD